MLDYELEEEGKSFEFNPLDGCQEECELALQYLLPCKCWIGYFYKQNEPIPINLFHPRWLINGPSVLTKRWNIRLDNFDYSRGSYPEEERYAGDQFARRGSQLIIDTAHMISLQHQNLPPGEAEAFAKAFQTFSKKLAKRQDERLQSLEEMPRRLPDPLVQPKLKFGPGRKRALTGREAADLEEEEVARERRRAERLALQQDISVARIEAESLSYSQHQDAVAEEYASQHTDLITLAMAGQRQELDTIASSDISRPENAEPSESEELSGLDEIQHQEEAVLQQDSASSGDDFPSVEELFSQRQELSALPSSLPTSSRPARERKPTVKQVSQNRRAIENEEKKKVKLAKKPKTANTTQLDEFELPFRSSQ
jgi:hypothetical protein